MAGGVWWFLAAYGLLGLTACSDALLHPSEYWLMARLGGDIESLKWFEHLVHPTGALAVGLLFDRRGARWCLTVSQLFAVVQHTARWLSMSSSMMYVSKVPAFFCHTHLVLTVLLVQMSSPERRAHTLAHAGLAYYVGRGVGMTVGEMAATRVSLHAGAGCAILGSLLGLAWARLLTDSRMLKDDLVNSRVSPVEPTTLGKASLGLFNFRESPDGISPLPEPAVMPLSWPVSREGLVQLLARPVVLQLILVQLCALGGQHIKDLTHGHSVMREFQVLLPYREILGLGMRLSDIIGMAFMIGPCIYRRTPRSFLCICLLWKTFVGLSVAVDFSQANPFRRLVPVQVWIAVIWVERMWSAALETVLTWLLASAVVRGQRGAVLGISAFLTLLPYMGSGVLARLLYTHGGAVAIFTASAAMNFFSLLVVRTVVLPNYREKAG